MGVFVGWAVISAVGLLASLVAVFAEKSRPL